jgi:FkbM family methyltransferase
MNDRPTVRVLRAAFRAWPFERGRGPLLRLSRLLVREPVAYHIAPRIQIEARLDEWMSRWTFMRLHERDESFQHSLHFLSPGSVAVDVGANVGVWSLLAAARHPDVRVHAFEPVPAVAETLRYHVALNRIDRIALNVAAVAAECGVAPFFVNQMTNTGASSLHHRPGPFVEISVDVVTLDTYLAHLKVDRIDVLKVDVEGGEISVFKGARRLLTGEQAPAVFFEIDARLCGAAGTSTIEVKQLLIDYGYTVFRRRGGRFVPVAIDEPHGHEDLFALKPRHLAG